MPEEKNKSAEALEILKRAFKDALLERMSRGSAAMPTFEDGFFEGIEYMSLYVFTEINIGMVSSAVISDFITANKIIVNKIANLHYILEHFHRAAHIYRAGNPNCAGIDRLQDELEAALAIGRKHIQNAQLEALKNMPMLPKNQQN